VPRVLVTGTSSGLGRALCRAMGAGAFDRASLDAEVERWARADLDLIVHCAADARRELPAGDLPAYLASNLTLTERLLGIPHRFFVYVSSQAVYPADGRAWAEHDPIPAGGALSIYGVFKLLAEAAVRARATRALILRCASLVGPEGRPNNIMRILRREPGRVFLSGACPYSLIAYSQVDRFIRECDEAGRSGVYNLGARDARTLAEIAGHLGAAIEFGDHLYVAPRADLSKLHRETAIFDRTTLEVADLVAGEIDAAGAAGPGPGARGPHA
jgi:nucleoside-diphosphate-sugar epimerase